MVGHRDESDNLEGLSILENAGALGLPILDKLKNAIEALKNG